MELARTVKMRNVTHTYVLRCEDQVYLGNPLGDCEAVTVVTHISPSMKQFKVYFYGPWGHAFRSLCVRCYADETRYFNIEYLDGTVLHAEHQ
jgi:hypothetical protein